MPVSGLVLTLSSDPVQRDAVLAALCDEPRVEPGRLEGHRLPIVVDTPDREKDEAVWAWLHGLPGVLFVDVVCVHHDEGQIGGDGGPTGTEQASSNCAGERS